MLKYDQLRTEILESLILLQEKQVSYQTICDFINQQQQDFVLYKDFFSRFQAKHSYFKGQAKQKKLALIHRLIHEFRYQNTDETDTIRLQLHDLIRNALSATFEAYLELNRTPAAPPSGLTNYYLENSPAHLALKKSLEHKKQYKWELDILHHSSNFKLLSFQTENLFSRHAVVTTKEHWNLFWVDSTSKQLQFKLELSSKQTYLLSRIADSGWRIAENRRTEQPNRKEPGFIDYSLLAKRSSHSSQENKITAYQFLSDDQPLSCIAFMKIAYANQLKENERYNLERIRKSCLHSYRLLNTDAINYFAFINEMALLKKQIKLMCDGIFLNYKKRFYTQH